jgi:hypothetical protein
MINDKLIMMGDEQLCLLSQNPPSSLTKPGGSLRGLKYTEPTVLSPNTSVLARAPEIQKPGGSSFHKPQAL